MAIQGDFVNQPGVDPIPEQNIQEQNPETSLQKLQRKTKDVYKCCLAQKTIGAIKENIVECLGAYALSGYFREKAMEVSPALAKCFLSTKEIGSFLGEKVGATVLPVLGYIPAAFLGKKVYQVTNKSFANVSDFKRKTMSLAAGLVVGVVANKLLIIPALTEAGGAMGRSLGGEMGEISGSMVGGFLAIKLLGSAEEFILGEKIEQTYAAKSFYCYLADKAFSLDGNFSQHMENSSFLTNFIFNQISGSLVFNSLDIKDTYQDMEEGVLLRGSLERDIGKRQRMEAAMWSFSEALAQKILSEVASFSFDLAEKQLLQELEQSESFTEFREAMDQEVVKVLTQEIEEILQPEGSSLDHEKIGELSRKLKENVRLRETLAPIAQRYGYELKEEELDSLLEFLGSKLSELAKEMVPGELFKERLIQRFLEENCIGRFMVSSTADFIHKLITVPFESATGAFEKTVDLMSIATVKGFNKYMDFMAEDEETVHRLQEQYLEKSEELEKLPENSPLQEDKELAFQGAAQELNGMMKAKVSATIRTQMSALEEEISEEGVLEEDEKEEIIEKMYQTAESLLDQKSRDSLVSRLVEKLQEEETAFMGFSVTSQEGEEKIKKILHMHLNHVLVLALSQVPQSLPSPEALEAREYIDFYKNINYLTLSHYSNSLPLIGQLMEGIDLRSLINKQIEGAFEEE